MHRRVKWPLRISKFFEDQCELSIHSGRYPSTSARIKTFEVTDLQGFVSIYPCRLGTLSPLFMRYDPHSYGWWFLCQWHVWNGSICIFHPTLAVVYMGNDNTAVVCKFWWDAAMILGSQYTISGDKLFSRIENWKAKDQSETFEAFFQGYKWPCCVDLVVSELRSCSFAVILPNSPTDWRMWTAIILCRYLYAYMVSLFTRGCSSLTTFHHAGQKSTRTRNSFLGLW